MLITRSHIKLARETCSETVDYMTGLYKRLLSNSTVLQLQFPCSTNDSGPNKSSEFSAQKKNDTDAQTSSFILGCMTGNVFLMSTALTICMPQLLFVRWGEKRHLVVFVTAGRTDRRSTRVTVSVTGRDDLTLSYLLVGFVHFIHVV